MFVSYVKIVDARLRVPQVTAIGLSVPDITNLTLSIPGSDYQLWTGDITDSDLTVPYLVGAGIE